jgi:hypothetical protein
MEEEDWLSSSSSSSSSKRIKWQNAQQNIPRGNRVDSRMAAGRCGVWDSSHEKNS